MKLMNVMSLEMEGVNAQKIVDGMLIKMYPLIKHIQCCIMKGERSDNNGK